MRDGTVIRVDLAEEWKNPGDWFKDVMRDVIPQHVALRAQNCTIIKLPSQRANHGRVGRRPNHDYIVLFNGWCVMKKKRSRAGNENDVAPTCTTSYLGGITLSELERFGQATQDIKIKLHIQFSGRCIHPAGAEYGTLTGRARDRVKKQVSIIFNSCAEEVSLTINVNSDI